MEKKVFSIITVCYNAENAILETIESVYFQKYDNYEYIIIDGLSKDGTLNILNSYNNKFKLKHIPYRIVSEKDNGIYDAMNKAIDIAEGEWLLFLNAGDYLIDSNILSNLNEVISKDIDVIYGDVLFLENKHYKYYKSKDTGYFKSMNPIPHQGSIIKNDIIKKYRFDLSYKIAADYDLFLKLYNNNFRFKRIDMAISVYQLGGVSSKKVIDREKEFNKSRKVNNQKNRKPLVFTLFNSIIYEVLRKSAILLFGKSFYSDRRGWYESMENALLNKIE